MKRLMSVKDPTMGQAYYDNNLVERIAKQVREAQAVLEKKREVPWYIIDPRSSKLVGYWDFMTSLALLFTAFVTPVEVGFLNTPEDRWRDPLFIVNRVVDSVFLFDMVLQFFTMYVVTDNDSAQGMRWVHAHPSIVRHYLTSKWFPIDVISIGVSGFDIFAPTGGDISRLKGLRAIRVVRLVKLIRLLRGSRIFSRWEMRLSINYAILDIVSLIVGLVFACHLFGCLWGLQASFDPLNTWTGPDSKAYCVEWDPAVDGPCEDGRVCSTLDNSSCLGWSNMYVYSVYWSIATVTSIGYGDVAASQFNEIEQLICTIMMFTGAIMFAYLVGSFCGLAANLAPEKREFRNDLTDLNTLMTEEGVPFEVRFRLREYLHHTMHLRRAKTRSHIFELLSEGMGAELALLINERFLKDVWFLEMCPELNLDLALCLTAQVFAPAERPPKGHLYILSKGRALYSGHVLRTGMAWGIDEILEASSLRMPFPAIASGYLHVYGIPGAKLREIIQKHENSAARIRKITARWTMRRGLVRAAEEKLMLSGQKGFHGRLIFILARKREDIPRVQLLDQTAKPNISPVSHEPTAEQGSGSRDEQMSAMQRQLDEMGEAQKKQEAAMGALQESMQHVLAALERRVREPSPTVASPRSPRLGSAAGSAAACMQQQQHEPTRPTRSGSHLRA